jgi:homocysteine S-methyltransferase
VVNSNADSGMAVSAHKGFYLNSDGTPKKKKLIAVELAPPANTQDEKLLEAAMSLKESDVDVLTFPDSPSGRTRVDSVLMAQKVKQATGMCVMPHICCRDKNAIAMRSLFLGAHINNINNMLIITGDPIPTMARQTTKSVFNFDSVGLMKIAQEMNEDAFASCPVTYCGAINQGRNRLDLEIKRVKKKMDAGAEFFLTQPVFSKEDANRVRKIREETGANILVGIMPLISRRNAIFMKNEIAGVNVTDEIISRYPENATKEQGEAIGVALAKEIMSYTEDFAQGYYFSFPFNRVYMLKEILEK